MATAQERKEAKECREREKQEEELASQQRLKEEKERRAKEKKERDALKKKEEEEKKKREDEAKQKAAEEEEKKAAAAANKDKPDDDINQHINEMNSGAGGTPTDGDGDEEARDAERSPQKKKKRKERTKSKKDRNKDTKDQEKVKQTFADAAKVTPLSRQGKFKPGGVMTAERKALREKLLTHTHKHKKWCVEMAVELIAEDKHAEFTLALRQFFTNVQTVCENAVIKPVKEKKGSRLVEPSDIPFNHTQLAFNIKIQKADTAFNKRKPWGKDKEDAELEDPVVYFTLAFSTDESPEEIIEGVRAEWNRNNGKKIFLKQVSDFKTYTPVVLYHVHNTASIPTMVAETREILEYARDNYHLDAMSEETFEYALEDVPVFGFRLQVPKIPGQDTSVFQGWKNREQFFRKALHLECAVSDGPVMEAMVALAKRMGLFTARWGKQAKIAVMAEKDADKVDLKAISSFAKHHIGYNASYTYDGISGVTALDKAVPVYSVTDPSQEIGRLTFREVLYTQFKLPGTVKPLPLFAEIHQRTPLSNVDTVIPNCEEAETMVAMMNKNLGFYSYHYLTSVAKMDSAFVKRLVQQCLDNSLLHDMDKCTWNEKTRVLTTPGDREREEEKAAQETAWYNDVFAEKTNKGKKKYANKAFIPNVDDEHSVHTLHKRPGKTYAGTPGAPSFNLGKGADEPIDVDSPEPGASKFLNMTREELIAALEKTQQKGSRPESFDSKSSRGDSSSESSSQTSGSSSDSASSVDEAAANDGVASRG